jgi:signal transduction histidine kinase
VPFVILQVAGTEGDYPGHRELVAWSAAAVFSAGAVAFFVLSRRPLEDAAWRPLAIAAQVFDTAIVAAFVLVYSFEQGTPSPQGLYLPLVAACVRFEVTGGLVVALVTAPVIVAFEWLRHDRFGDAYRWDYVTLRVGIELLIALIVGWLVARLNEETRRASSRAEVAEGLSDELGRRADLIDATNRCARALGSSLDLNEAFGAFIRELRGLLAFDHVAIVLADDGMATVMAAAGIGAESVLAPGSQRPLEGSTLQEILGVTRPVVRPELAASSYAEEVELARLGLGSRLAAPLLSGTRPVGMLSLGRRETDAFTADEAELVGLLGRLVASAVENIRSYDAERRTVVELRRLSTLRSDFVAVVSHELRTPLTSVIGSARTLQDRWRDLTPEHRDKLLAVAVNEADRLATLVGDVLDTSRIDAGIFSYTMGEVDIGELVAGAVAAASSDGVGIVERVDGELPPIHGDGSRLRQVLSNLIDNAIKYSPRDGIVEVRAAAVHRRVVVDVTDRGDGIATEDLELIFEKFGRVSGQTGKPGTGLGLYIARAIAEAHGGSLEVDSAPGRGSTFTLTLPLR